jgi:hypothetical protein
MYRNESDVCRSPQEPFPIRDNSLTRASVFAPIRENTIAKPRTDGVVVGRYLETQLAAIGNNSYDSSDAFGCDSVHVDHGQGTANEEPKGMGQEAGTGSDFPACSDVTLEEGAVKERISNCGVRSATGNDR